VSPARLRVLIAGGGVAGLEAVLALRALAADRVDVTIVSPELSFINRSMAVDQPFKRRRGRGIRLEDAAAELGARWHRGALDRVEPAKCRAVTRDGDELPYDALVLAVGARSEREWRSEDVLTYHDGRDAPGYRLLLHRLRDGLVNRVAFVKPAGATWPLPLYDLALMTAADCAARGLSEVELSLVTPEEQPLGIFGNAASAAIRRLLDERRVTLHTSCYGVPSRRGWLAVSPGRRRLAVDRVVTLPRLAGPRIRGVPCGRDGFIPTDVHGRVIGLDGVFAAGDATDFPVKQSGLAAQQADAVAETIAVSAGVDVDPRPFRPVLRGVLLTGGSARYLRSDISGHAGDDSAAANHALWWPPNKLAGRYLAPYLSSRTGAAADVMPQLEHAIRVETGAGPAAQATRGSYGELRDLAPQKHKHVARHE
jgi:sulfide:quinone oxidoreductase